MLQIEKMPIWSELPLIACSVPSGLCVYWAHSDLLVTRISLNHGLEGVSSFASYITMFINRLDKTVRFDVYLTFFQWISFQNVFEYLWHSALGNNQQLTWKQTLRRVHDIWPMLHRKDQRPERRDSYRDCNDLLDRTRIFDILRGVQLLLCLLKNK